MKLELGCFEVRNGLGKVCTSSILVPGTSRQCLALWEHDKSFENKNLTFPGVILSCFESMIILEAEITLKYLLYWKEVVVDKNQ